jgi:hypothetical protein
VSGKSKEGAGRAGSEADFKRLTPGRIMNKKDNVGEFVSLA